LPEFLEWFRDEADCVAYLAKVRWPAGFRCPACGGEEAWLSRRRGLYLCADRRCGRQTSVRVGTIFERSHLSLLTWFQAIWCVSTQKSGVSALALKRQRGLRSYETAWTMLHKLRVAMKRPGRDDDRLHGYVEVDETLARLNTGSTAGLPRTRGRGTDAVLVGIAVEQGDTSGT
jgi:Transposase zinc-ribbon domain